MSFLKAHPMEHRVFSSKDEYIEPTDDELELIKQHKLSLAQIKWRRSKQKELKHLFIQEYPEDPVTCFLTSGASYFGDLLGRIFTAPMDAQYDPDHVYCAGLDFGQTNDFTAMPVYDKTTKQQVDLLHINKLAWREIRKRIRNMLLGKWSSMTCASGHTTKGIWNNEEEKIYDYCPTCKNSIVRYKKAKLAAETNNVGSVNIEALMDDGLDIMLWTTNNVNKSELMSDMYDAFDTGGWRVQPWQIQKHEFSIFTSTQLPSGVWRLAAEGDGHDVAVIGNGLAIWACTNSMQIF